MIFRCCTNNSLIIFTCLVALIPFISGCEGSEIIAEISGGSTSDRDSDTSDRESESSDRESESSDRDSETDDAGTGTHGYESKCGNLASVERDVFYIDDANDVNEMEGITQIRGSLVIGNFDAEKVNMSAFESLRCVEGDLVIHSVRNLENLNRFYNLRHIKYVFAVTYNNDLSSLSGLKHLEEIGGDELYIFGNSDLGTCIATDFYTSMVDRGWDGSTCISENARDGCDDIESGCINQTH